MFAKDGQTSQSDVTSSWLVALPLPDKSIHPLLHCTDHYFKGFNKILIFTFLDFPIYIWSGLRIALLDGIQDTFHC